MKRLFILTTIFFYCLPTQAQEYDTKKMRYIEQFKYWAMDEQIRTNVPAAISLAQGILETGSGTSDLCLEANNHFGIKCKKEWTGETFLHDDDRRRECFRKYKSAKESFIDHSNFLKERAHYAFLFDLEVTDYQEWCKGLRKAGYATNPKYADRLIQLIEEYNLQEYTYEALELAKQNVVAEVVPLEDKIVEKTKPIVVPPRTKVSSAQNTEVETEKVFAKLITKNGQSGFWARKGDYLLPEAVQYNIRYAKLLAINDLDDEPLYDDMFIYLKKKSKKGIRSYYEVKEGESLHLISQNTGVQLKYLYSYNNMYEGEEPAAGEKIYLQGRSTRTPKLVGSSQIAAAADPDNISGMMMKEKEVKKTAVIAERKEVKVEEKETVKEVVQETKKVEVLPVKKIEESKTVAVEKVRQEKVVTKEIVKDPRIIKQADKKEVAVVTEKPANATRTSVSTIGVSADSPVLNLNKAKRVEQLMGDGKSEVDKLYKPIISETPQPKDTPTAKEVTEEKIVEKVIPAPGTNNTELQKLKAAKNKKKEVVEKSKPNNDNKNVSDDVKDLKNKFDILIYDED